MRGNPYLTPHVQELLVRHNCTLKELKENLTKLHLLRTTKRQVEFLFYQEQHKRGK